MRLIYRYIDTQKEGADWSYEDPTLEEREGVIQLDWDRVNRLEKSINSSYGFTTIKGRFHEYGVNKSTYKADSGIARLSKKEDISKHSGSHYEFDKESVDSYFKNKEEDNAPD